MAEDITSEQFERLIRELGKLKGAREQSEVLTKGGFRLFLERLGLDVLARKIAESPLWAQLWEAITGLFQVIQEKWDDAVDWIAGALNL
jgi:hypothetical protein